MTVTIARIVLCGFITAASASLEASVLIVFRAEAVVESGIVTLKDIADIRSADPVDRQKLSAVIVGPAPGADRTTTIDFETVRSRLLSAGVSLADIQFSGPATTTLFGPKSSAKAAITAPRSTTVSVSSGNEIQTAIEAAVRRYLATRGSGQSYAVAAQLSPEAMSTVAAADRETLEVAGGSPPWTDTQTFTLRFLNQNGAMSHIDVTCEVSLRPSVLAAKHALPRGHVVRADDLVWRKAESDEEASCATDPKLVLGMETQQSIRTGQGIAHSLLKAVPLVRNGQFVTVTSRRPGMSVQRVMKAKVDGTAGEIIALLTLEDRKTVMARVTGLQEAEVVGNDIVGSSQSDAIASTVRRPGPDLPKPSHSNSDAPNQMWAAGCRVHVNPVQALSVPEMY